MVKRGEIIITERLTDIPSTGRVTPENTLVRYEHQFPSRRNSGYIAGSTEKLVTRYEYVHRYLTPFFLLFSRICVEHILHSVPLDPMRPCIHSMLRSVRLTQLEHIPIGGLVVSCLECRYARYFTRISSA